MTRYLLLAGVLLLGACKPGGQAPGPHADDAGGVRFGQVDFKPCALSQPGAPAVEAQCATVSVPENHAAPKGRHIDLAVALVMAKGQAEPDPLVLLAGGPGQSALESYPLVQGAFADARRNRNVLLVDARGTGKSHPLKCADAQGDEAVLDPDTASPDVARAFTERCLKALSRTSDVRFYGTADHVRDLDHVRGLLGVPQLNLVGVSYGTRVAQQFAMTHPDRVRTIVLDSVVPNDAVLGQDFARNLEESLAAQFALCSKDTACDKTLGDPRANLDAVRATLDAGGIAPVQYRDPATGAWRSDVPTFDHLAALLRLYAYAPQTAATLPLVLRQARDGHYESMLAQSRWIYDSVSDSIAQGMQLSVTCSEDVDELKDDPRDADSVMGTNFTTFIRAQCAVWPRGERVSGFRKPLTGQVPVLVVSGQFDPVTPPRYGAPVIAALPNARQLIVPGQGHGVLGVGCMPKLFAQFIETADAKGLDATCLDRLAATPPFAGDYGWEP